MLSCSSETPFVAPNRSLRTNHHGIGPDLLLWLDGLTNKQSVVTRPGKRLHNELGNHHAIHGKLNYFYGDLNHSYVSLPEGKPMS